MRLKAPRPDIVPPGRQLQLIDVLAHGKTEQEVEEEEEESGMKGKIIFRASHVALTAVSVSLASDERLLLTKSPLYRSDFLIPLFSALLVKDSLLSSSTEFERKDVLVIISTSCCPFVSYNPFTAANQIRVPPF